MTSSGVKNCLPLADCRSLYYRAWQQPSKVTSRPESPGVEGWLESAGPSGSCTEENNPHSNTNKPFCPPDPDTRVHGTPRMLVTSSASAETPLIVNERSPIEIVVRTVLESGTVWDNGTRLDSGSRRHPSSKIPSDTSGLVKSTFGR